MKKVLIRAPLLTNSGYGVHSRQIFYWLLEKSKKENIKIDVECLNWGHCPWIVDGTMEDGLIQEIMDRSVQPEGQYDVTFQVQLPDEWNPKLGKYNVGVTAAVETDRCNPNWNHNCNDMDCVVVPSTFTKNVIKRSGYLKKPPIVIPEWYHKDIDEPQDDLDLNLETKFNFLTVGMLTHKNSNLDRKNLTDTIVWFCEKFKDNPDVGLIVKTSLGKLSSFDRKATDVHFRELMNRIGKSHFPKVYLLHGAMTKKEIASLYRDKNVKAYITLTRGEGYGLPLVESAAAGLPIIATGWSGHLEFLKSGTYLNVEYNMKEIPKEKVDNRIFFEGVRWADPIKQSYFTRLDDLYYNYDLHKANALEHSTHIKENYSRGKIIDIYEKCFNEVL